MVGGGTDALTRLCGTRCAGVTRSGADRPLPPPPCRPIKRAPAHLSLLKPAWTRLSPFQPASPASAHFKSALGPGGRCWPHTALALPQRCTRTARTAVLEPPPHRHIHVHMHTHAPTRPPPPPSSLCPPAFHVLYAPNADTHTHPYTRKHAPDVISQIALLDNLSMWVWVRV